MKLYSRSALYSFYLWCFAVGRLMFVITGGSLLFVVVKAKVGGHATFDLPLYIVFTFISWFIIILLGVAIACLLKCDMCGKRPFTWDINYKEQSASTLVHRFIDTFYLPELRQKKFRCIHCNTEFSLQGYE